MTAPFDIETRTVPVDGMFQPEEHRYRCACGSVSAWHWTESAAINAALYHRRTAHPDDTEKP